jgi:cephalosporin-C deacetylase-like acetyl esterase
MLRAVALSIALGPLAAHADDAFNDLKRLFDYDAREPLDVQQTLMYERDGVKVYDVTYASPKGGRVTAYLVTPITSEPHAGLVFGHWGPGNRTEFLPEATLYARQGAVSLLIDYPWVRPSAWRKPLKGEAAPETDHVAKVQAVVDLRRGFDLLATRPDVDPKRFAYVGHSFGAQFGAILSAVEPRLVGVVLMAGIPDQAAIYRDSNDPAIIEYRSRTPKDLQEAFFKSSERTDAVRYVPHAAVPLLFQFARHETYFDQAAMKRYAEAAPFRKEIKWYDTGHELNDPQALFDRAAWLRAKVGIGPIESTIKPPSRADASEPK